MAAVFQDLVHVHVLHVGETLPHFVECPFGLVVSGHGFATFEVIVDAVGIDAIGHEVGHAHAELTLRLGVRAEEHGVADSGGDDGYEHHDDRHHGDELCAQRNTTCWHMADCLQLLAIQGLLLPDAEIKQVLQPIGANAHDYDDEHDRDALVDDIPQKAFTEKVHEIGKRAAVERVIQEPGDDRPDAAADEREHEDGADDFQQVVEPAALSQICRRNGDEHAGQAPVNRFGIGNARDEVRNVADDDAGNIAAENARQDDTWAIEEDGQPGKTRYLRANVVQQNAD